MFNIGRKKNRIGIYPHGPMQWHDNGNMGSFRVVYELTPQLEDHAQEYAYMSLALAPFRPSGRGVQAGSLRTSQPPQMYAPQTAGVNGIPTWAGQVGLTPLSKG